MRGDFDYEHGGPTINVETPQELWGALGVLHTQVLDNFPAKIAGPYMLALSDIMDRVATLADKP